jgi:hypothetical protein
VKEKPTVGSSLFETFISDCIPKTTKSVNVHLFIHSFSVSDEFIKDIALEVKKMVKTKTNSEKVLQLLQRNMYIYIYIFYIYHYSQKHVFLKDCTERSKANREGFLINPVGVCQLIMLRTEEQMNLFLKLG